MFSGVNILVGTNYGSIQGIIRGGAFMKRGRPSPVQGMWTLLAEQALQCEHISIQKNVTSNYSENAVV